MEAPYGPFQLPKWETRAFYLNAFADSYFGRPSQYDPGLSEKNQKWRAEQYDEWMVRLSEAKKWEEDFPHGCR